MMKLMKYALLVLMFAIVAVSSVAAGFEEGRPWLAERSAWSETATGGEGLRGWWALGNSRVFGIVGAEIQNAMIHQITGPHIHLASVMNPGSAFGPARIRLIVGDKQVNFTKSTLSRVRNTDIVVMTLESDDPSVRMTVYNYAPFDVNAILRTVVLKNTGKQPLSNVVLIASLQRTVAIGGDLYDSFKGSTDGNAIGFTRRMWSNFIEGAEAASTPDKNGTLTVKLGNLVPGAEVVRTQYMVFSMQKPEGTGSVGFGGTYGIGDEAKTLALVKKQGVGLLKNTYDDWRNWLAGTATIYCPDRKLSDLLNDTKILVRVQTAEPQGAAGPMEFFAGVWVRDSNGPARYYLRMGRFDAMRKMLEFCYRTSAYAKSIPNWRPMDVDVTVPVPKDFDWTKVPMDRVENPCWLIMQHAWYYAYTGDIEPIKSHWGYLSRLMMGQLIDENGKPFHHENYGSVEPGWNEFYRFPHHGDETWIYPGFEVLNSGWFPEPNDHPHWDEFSVDSTWEFVVSADIMADFAKRIGKAAEADRYAKIAKDARAALERDYWIPEKGLYGPAMGMRSLDLCQPPFTMVNLNPLWIGYLKPGDPKAVSNVLATMKYTMNPNYVTDATETLRIYVGMQPGMFLYNLAAINHPYAEHALTALVEVASPSGEYTEKHATEPTSYKSSFHGHRIRPWEGGINADAVYYYLFGIEPAVGDGRVAICPRLPSRWNKMALVNQRLGDGKMDISVEDNGFRRSYKIRWTGSKPIAVDFTIALPQCEISSVIVGKAKVSVSPSNRWGITTAKMPVKLAAGSVTTIVVAYKKQPAEPLPFTRERYTYVVPKDVPYHDLVLWDAEPRKGNAKDYRTFDYLKQAGVNYRLITSFVPSSPEWLKPFLLKSDGTPNTKLFFMTSTSISNSLKYRKWWGDPELTKLFNDYMDAGGIIVMLNAGEPDTEWFGDLFGASSYKVQPFNPANPNEVVEIVPADGQGGEAFAALGLLSADAKLTSKRVFSSCSGLVVLASVKDRPDLPVAVAKKYGGGLLISIQAELSYEQTAGLGRILVNPNTAASLSRLISGASL
jgi:GH15 family glucan-1,4-alpha-glucosidase